MPAKHAGQIFQKRHLDTDKFIAKGAVTDLELAKEPPTSMPSEDALKVLPPAITSESPLKQLSVAMPHIKARKIAMTYKHKEANYDRLKWLSQRLKVSMGELIDEALEAKFHEWKLQVPPDPEF